VLRPAEVAAREDEHASVLTLPALDPVELDVREVVRLGGALDLEVDLVDLREDLLRVRLFRGDRVGVGRCRAGHGQAGDEAEDERRRPFCSETDHVAATGRSGRTGGGRYVTSPAP
jgi:hypothetical protein